MPRQLVIAYATLKKAATEVNHAELRLSARQHRLIYKPLMIFNVIQSARLLTDGCHNFRVFLIEATEPNTTQIARFVERSLMLVTALSPVIGYDKASKVAHHALDHDTTLREAALALGFVDAEEFDRLVKSTRRRRTHQNPPRNASAGR